MGGERAKTLDLIGELSIPILNLVRLLEVVYALLKQGRPYLKPDPEQMHALEKAKLVQHHASRLQKLGGDETLVGQLLAQHNSVPVCSPPPQKPVSADSPSDPPPERIRKTCPAKVRRGALGVRARQTPPQEYSVLKEKKARPSRKRRPSKRKQSSTTKTKPAT